MGLPAHITYVAQQLPVTLTQQLYKHSSLTYYSPPHSHSSPRLFQSSSPAQRYRKPLTAFEDHSDNVEKKRRTPGEQGRCSSAERSECVYRI